MGQQQLLLLVLGIVIVGLAVVVGINAFGENQKRANADALVNDGLRIASDIQAWALKPEQFGGAGGWSTTMPVGETGFFAEEIGYTDVNTAGEYTNVNGTFAVDITGEEVQIKGENTSQDNEVYISVCGVRSGDIFTDIVYDPSGGSDSYPGCSGSTP
jgi:hypothetical protein